MNIINRSLKQIPVALRCVIIFLSIMLPATIVVIVSYQYFVFYLFKAELLIVGWFSWTFAEYMIHRFGYHENSRTHTGHLKQLHQYHHTHPTEIKLKSSVRIMLIVISIFSLALALWLNVYFLLMSGFLFGVAIFFLMHYIIHQSWSVVFFPRLHRYHIYHHCRYPDHCHGISVTWWDMILNTTPPDEKEISDKTKTFYYGEITRKS